MTADIETRRRDSSSATLVACLLRYPLAIFATTPPRYCGELPPARNRGAQGQSPVARIVPLKRRRQWLPAAEVIGELVRLGPDTTNLGEELRETLTQTTDDVRW